LDGLGSVVGVAARGAQQREHMRRISVEYDPPLVAAEFAGRFTIENGWW